MQMEKILDFFKKITLKQWAMGIMCTTLLVMVVMICVVSVKIAPLAGILMSSETDPTASTAGSDPSTQGSEPDTTTLPTESSQPPVTTEEGHVHEFTLTKVNQPTCTSSGFSVYTCSCGQAEARDFTDPLGHSYGAGKVVAATCTEEGGTYYTCTVCGYKLIRDAQPALGHSFSSWRVTTAPTATQEGVETRVCMTCGEQETRSIPATGEITEPTTQPTEPPATTQPTEATQPTEPPVTTPPTEVTEPPETEAPTEYSEPSNSEEPEQP